MASYLLRLNTYETVVFDSFLDAEIIVFDAQDYACI